MREREILNSFDEGLVNYRYAEYGDIYSCTQREWHLYLVKKRLVDQGVCGKDIEEFEAAVREAAIEDY